MPDYGLLARREREMRMQQNHTFDQHHKARQLDPLAPGDLVWIPQNQKEGTMVTEVALRSYQVTSPSGVLRRNCQQLRLLPLTPTLHVKMILRIRRMLVIQSLSTHKQLTACTEQEA